MYNNEIFEITKIMNNIKNHDFSVQTYRMVKEEADIVNRALAHYLWELKHDSDTEH